MIYFGPAAPQWQVELPKGPEGFTPVAPPNPQENCVGKSFLGGIMGTFSSHFVVR